MLQESKTTEERRKFEVRVLDDQMDLVGGLTFPLGHLYVARVFIAPAQKGLLSRADHPGRGLAGKEGTHCFQVITPLAMVVTRVQACHMLGIFSTRLSIT